jgi:hypothetical protein
MVIFSWLLVGHVVGDYLFQIRWMAENKSRRFLPLIVHSAVYTLIVALFSLLKGGLSWQGIGLIFLCHVILDQRKFIEFWAKYITGTANIEWLKIALDQSWHILILGLATLL